MYSLFAIFLKRPSGQNCRITIKQLWLLLLLLVISSSTLWAGSYTDSAHGSNDTGVFRPVIGDAPPDGFGYARGNCAHCHEQHASIEGSEPDPDDSSGPSFYALFTSGFEYARQTNEYFETDNFCFYCHNSAASVQQVNNNNYSQNFGCGPQGPTSILAAMNQDPGSYHNLYDIHRFAKDNFASWFKDQQSNPCSACHNPHLARRNWNSPKDPAYSAISKPSNHFSLWGPAENETMGDIYNTNYEPPYCSSTPALTREPANSADADAGRANTPDYVAFCTDCHNASNNINSTTLARLVYTIDWGASATGDKHGERAHDGTTIEIRPPYSASNNYVLSCSDCHEPHGSANGFLTRGEVNKSVVTIPSDRGKWRTLCQNCHGNSSNTHHLINPGDCTWNCHYFVWDPDLGAMITEYRECIVCHFHGSTQIWNGTTNLYEVYNGGQHIF